MEKDREKIHEIMYWDLLKRYVELKDQNERTELLFSKLLLHRIKDFQLERNGTQKD